MANTFGHTVRRYVGEKIYYATIAQRKAIMIADLGADPSDAPFWASASCVCDECAECQAIIAQRADILRQGMDADPTAWLRAYEADCLARAMERYEAALRMPEPAVTLTGVIIAVEWEEESGYRMWETMDEGELDRAIWQAHLRGAALSDVDEPAR